MKKRHDFAAQRKRREVHRVGWLRSLAKSDKHDDGVASRGACRSRRAGVFGAFTSHLHAGQSTIRCQGINCEAAEMKPATGRGGALGRGDGCGVGDDEGHGGSL